MILDDDEPLAVPRHWNAMLTSQPAVLYVENNVLLSRLVSDLLDLAGWHVRRAESGTIAQMFLRHEQRFALLLVDNELSDTTGLAVVTYARTLAHRASVPIILFSLEDCEREAKKAGANEFLRKPHDLFLLVETARKLIAAGEEKR
ncbi:MAG TPA: response regulator [Pyrinomonadaceae bacterium]|nr:response regulator [Pyrinomonadaceae bacterium]